ncbi:uncharacterized mitochondrial protein AtMg00810-like [Helianthus annuus]|uniref:uncharacterized mitochondrial protein AtMg00810-like n=1 Tax=Helianthus annuus TaxID=4232 RepID=UPI000B9033C7|nr:uncharacterized mitochondrial protein AtMg00810-like [Helianthus annuus]
MTSAYGCSIWGICHEGFGVSVLFFLGIQVERDGNHMFLSQEAYVRDIIHGASMDSCKPIATPVGTQTKLSSDSGPLHDDPTTYRSLAGALQYLTFTRPDISYAVQQVCMNMHSPRIAHWNALKRIIRYIQGTSDFGLHLGPAQNFSLVAYTDVDWAGCPDTFRSTSGYCVYMGDNLISWSSKRQSTISRSSAEAEYRGVANVVVDICCLRNLLLELHHPLSRATLVYYDNVSAIYLSIWYSISGLSTSSWIYTLFVNMFNAVTLESFMCLLAIRSLTYSPKASLVSYSMTSDPV